MDRNFGGTLTAMLASSMNFQTFWKWLSRIVKNAFGKLKAMQIISLKYLQEWDELKRFGSDYYTIKESYEEDCGLRKTTLNPTLSSPGTAFVSPKIEKLPSVQRAITLVEQLSLTLPLCPF